MSNIYNMQINAGATFSLVINVTDSSDNAIDLTGYTARTQFRENIDDDTTAFEATTANGKLVTTDAANGELTLTISDTETAAFNGPFVYDLEIESSGGVVDRIMEGQVYVSPEVTR